ncbi:MAG: 4'-phosphopantetheinyl transferase superfamily protein [Lachnospiraceae bacterium]|nr:4'-phosphopantetheinyl transferase superfamily protein [Lachnospiraceae bacterium]
MIYIASIDTCKADDLLPLVCEERREYALKYRMEADRIRSLACALLLQYAYTDAGGKVLKAIRLTHDDNGKPVILEDAPSPLPYFSISHTGSYVAVATGNTPVGIDIERIRTCNDSIIRRFFSGEEQAFINGEGKRQAGLSRPAATDLAFTQIWTLKESFLKATGQGMKLGLDTFSVIGENGDFTVRQDHDDHTYTGEILEAPDGYVLSVCRMNGENTEKDNGQGGMIHEICLSALLP